MDEFKPGFADKIYVAGHRGMVGSAIVRQLQAKGHRNILTRTHAELDLTDQAGVNRFFGGFPSQKDCLREKPHFPGNRRGSAHQLRNSVFFRGAPKVAADAASQQLRYPAAPHAAGPDC